MKKATNRKAFMLSLAMVFGMLLPLTINAQKSDGFFRGGYDNYENRDATINDNGEIGHYGIGETVPVGSGLLVLVAAGAGYAALRRKRRHGAAMILALTMILTMSGCKKKVETIQSIVSEGTPITLIVDDNTRVVVDPEHPQTQGDHQFVPVTFEKNDVIYVGCEGNYVGTLTYKIDNEGEPNEHRYFEGTVNITSEQAANPLDFYFLGGKDFAAPTITGNTATLSISDQSASYPVISYDRSHVIGGVHHAKLMSKCSIMKFNVTTPSEAAICITGMNNKVTVDFTKPTGTDNGFTYSKDGEGVIKMKGGSGSPAVKWAIVLPQAALTTTGDAYSADNVYIGTRPTMDAITSNQYLSTGVALTVNTAGWDGNLANIKNGSTESFATARDGMTITGTLGVNKKVSIAAGATVTLDGATINGTHNDSYTWAGLTCKGDATIILKDGTTNTIKGFNMYYSGIYVPSGNTLTIQGTGSLNASSNGYAAGIGASDITYGAGTCGNIIIESGTITATGGAYSAGIGGGNMSNCGTITIRGGSVTATGGSEGTGIGSGADSSNCGAITISGGTINATSGNNAAGIGGSCGNITITGGTVTATGKIDGAGIGSSAHKTCGDITISDGITSVTARRGADASHIIGAGVSGTCGTITIDQSLRDVTTGDTRTISHSK